MLAYGCAPGTSAQGLPTPLPVVADLGGVKAEGRLEPIRYVELSPVVNGLVSAVLVSEGDRVEAGQLIASLDTANALSLETARNQSGIELGDGHEALRVANEALDAYQLPRVFSGLSAEEAARSWLTELDAARAAFAPFKNTSRMALKPRSALNEFVYPSLPKQVLVDTHEYDDVAMVHKKRLDVAWTNYTKAVEWLNLDAAVVEAQARVDEAQRRFDSLQADLSSTDVTGTRSALASADIRAPFAGTVTALNLKVGEVVMTGSSVVTVADLSGWIVKTTDLTEIDVTSVQQGTRASIVFDAAPDKSLPGHVISVDLTFTDRQGDVLYPVDVLLGESPAWLRWGMTAEVTFGE